MYSQSPYLLPHLAQKMSQWESCGHDCMCKTGKVHFTSKNKRGKQQAIYAFLTFVNWALPVVQKLFFSWNLNRNIGIASILRVQLTFNEHWFRRYGISTFCPFLSFLAQKGHFRSSEECILYETLIETYTLRSFWGVNQLHTISGWRDSLN